MTEIWSYLAREASQEIATRMVRTLTRRMDGLSAAPELGSPRSSIYPGLRALIVTQYLVYSQVVEPEIVIVRVLHGSRDQSALIGQ